MAFANPNITAYAVEATEFPDLVRRFMPDADQRMVTVAAIWLLGQCSVFVRNREQLAEPPVGLVLDEQAIEWLSASISNWVVSGLRPMRTN